MIVLITGMSATGKSTAVRGLRRAGFEAVDCDSDTLHGRPFVVEVPDPAAPSGSERLLDPEAFGALLAQERTGPLFVSVCVRNQQAFRGHFDHVVLLTAPESVVTHRLATRTGNPYGKDPGERAEVLANLAAVEPLLRDAADVVIDTGTNGPSEVLVRLRALVAER